MKLLPECVTSETKKFCERSKWVDAAKANPKNLNENNFRDQLSEAIIFSDILYLQQNTYPQSQYPTVLKLQGYS